MLEIEAKSPVGTTANLATYAARLSYEDLPAEMHGALKQLFLDTLGTTLAGSTLGVGCREVIEVVRSSGGLPESTVLGFGEKVPAVMAALANGAMGHALNYDATGAEGGHLGVTALAAPLAVSERVGGVSGREFLAGLAAGAEITARIAAAIVSVKGSDHHAKALEGQLLGYFGATVSAGRIMRLTPRQMHSALGLALMQAAGSMQIVLDGDPPAKAVYGAFPNHAGVMSALLSERGLIAECNALEGAAGLFALYYGGRYSQAVLEGGLGEKFLSLGVRFKPWPTSGILHPFIEAALNLSANKELESSAIQHVQVRGGDHIGPFCEPVQERRRPHNAAAAANSIYFAVAKALVNGTVALGDFTSNGLDQAEVVKLAMQIDCSIDRDIGRSAVLEVTTQKGDSYNVRVDKASTVNYDQLIAKFLDCAQYAARPISRDSLDRVIDLIEHLEELKDVGVLVHLVSGGR